MPYGEYPLVVTPDEDPEGNVLVVSDYAYAKYLGRLDVEFDNDGRVVGWGGNPILLDGSVEQGELFKLNILSVMMSKSYSPQLQYYILVNGNPCV